jgi:hypothetical protein
MNRFFGSLLTLAIGVGAFAMTGDTAQAVWGHGRVSTSYSLPSVPAVSYSPVVVGRPVYAAPVYSAPVVAARPVVAYSAPTVAYSAPTVAYSAPTVANSAPAVAYSAPSVAFRPAVPVNQTTVVRGLFGRPRFVVNSPAGFATTVGYAPSAYVAPATSTYYAPSYSTPIYGGPVSTFYAPSVVAPSLYVP